MSNRSSGRGLFYHRDSGGQHETTPPQYVEWACRKAKELGLAFDGTPQKIDRMIRDGEINDGDLFLDYIVCGNTLTRKALDALFARVATDPEVTHIFIPRRDRLARPDNPMDGIRLEDRLREAGKTIVLLDKTLPPLAKGKRRDIGDMISALVEYDQSGKVRRDLAEKMIYAQIKLAEDGFSTGGRAPFAFRRWLAKDDGTPVRQLLDGERVRMAGHHVVWLPGPREEVELALRIRKLLKTVPASQVVKLLNAEGIPSPDAGRLRTDGNIKHRVTGRWSQSTIVNIGRNPLFTAMTRYGVRSLGDQVRFSPDGPRDLRATDFRGENLPKVIRNPEETQISTVARFEPLVDHADHQELGQILDRRSGTQRGKARSRNPALNPLGCRIIDMNCTWMMYRTPYNKSFRYTCGYYQQTHGQECAHNHVDGPTATRFALSCIRQKLVLPGMRQKLKARLEKMAAAAAPSGRKRQQEVRRLMDEKSSVEQELKTVSRNLALAHNDELHHAIAAVFGELTERKKQLDREIAKAERAMTLKSAGGAAGVEGLLVFVDRLTALANNADDFSVAKELFDLTNIRVFFRFKPEQRGKRLVNEVAGGQVTFGAAEPPVEIYSGPTDRSRARNIRDTGEGHDVPVEQIAKKRCGSVEESDSLGNVNRDDRIRTCDLLTPSQAR